jgi:cytochrome b6-f complex iron-sulfur subunit
MESISRKNFIEKTGKTGLAVCLGLGMSSLLHSCKSIQRVQAPLLDEIIRIDEKFVNKEQELLVENEALPAPVYLSKSSTGYQALLLLCTHKECEVNPTGEVFTCPCHGSQFTKAGERISGPAEKALTQFKTESKDGQVFIYLNQILKELNL